MASITVGPLQVTLSVCADRAAVSVCELLRRALLVLQGSGTESGSSVAIWCKVRQAPTVRDSPAGTSAHTLRPAVAGVPRTEARNALLWPTQSPVGVRGT